MSVIDPHGELVKGQLAALQAVYEPAGELAMAALDSLQRDSPLNRSVARRSR